ncbi:MAG: 2OG-Fe(II) oxygenase [Kiloniellaceae bacterium]
MPDKSESRSETVPESKYGMSGLTQINAVPPVFQFDHRYDARAGLDHWGARMSMLDLHAFRATPLSRDPFDFLVVPGFLKAEALPRVRDDFPNITRAGLFPLSEVSYGPRFAELIEEIRSAQLEAAFCEKFGLDLSGNPLMVTVRGRCQKKDGRIHTDTKSKIVTALLYLNAEWEADGGRLRVLRGPDDLNDMIAEVPPHGGTLIAFRPCDNSWHGHMPYEGDRRYVMLNWMSDAAVAVRELGRHRVSAKIKRYLPFT